METLKPETGTKPANTLEAIQARIAEINAGQSINGTSYAARRLNQLEMTELEEKEQELQKNGTDRAQNTLVAKNSVVDTSSSTGQAEAPVDNLKEMAAAGSRFTNLVMRDRGQPANSTLEKESATLKEEERTFGLTTEKKKMVAKPEVNANDPDISEATHDIADIEQEIRDNRHERVRLMRERSPEARANLRRLREDDATLRGLLENAQKRLQKMSERRQLCDQLEHLSAELDDLGFNQENATKREELEKQISEAENKIGACDDEIDAISRSEESKKPEAPTPASEEPTKINHDVEEEKRTFGMALQAQNSALDERAQSLPGRGWEYVKNIADEYRKLPFGYKLGVGLGFVALAGASTTIGGTFGAALGFMGLAGQAGQRALSQVGTFYAIEGMAQGALKSIHGGADNVPSWQKYAAAGVGVAGAMFLGPAVGKLMGSMFHSVGEWLGTTHFAPVEGARSAYQQLFVDPTQHAEAAQHVADRLATEAAVGHATRVATGGSADAFLGGAASVNTLLHWLRA